MDLGIYAIVKVLRAKKIQCLFFVLFFKIKIIKSMVGDVS